MGDNDGKHVDCPALISGFSVRNDLMMGRMPANIIIQAAPSAEPAPISPKSSAPTTSTSVSLSHPTKPATPASSSSPAPPRSTAALATKSPAAASSSSSDHVSAALKATAAKYL